MRQITINGRIGQDVIERVSKSGRKYISFSIGTSEFGDPKGPDDKPITQWYRVTSFLDKHINMTKHFTKGRGIIVSGNYSNSIYQNKTTGAYSISNDVIANEIYFESHRDKADENTGNVTQDTISVNNVEQQYVNNAIEQIPQVTQQTKLQEPVRFEMQTNDIVDDLPF